MAHAVRARGSLSTRATEDQGNAMTSTANPTSPPPPTNPAAEYQPGVCNIGPAEIARRRQFGHVAAVSGAALLGVLLATRAPRPTRLLLAVPAGGAASGYLQARAHFCSGFGSRGVYNFASLGEVHDVVDPQARAKDAATSRRINLQSLGIGLAAAGLAVALPR